MQVLRKFSVEVIEPVTAEGDYTKGKRYPVLAMDAAVDGTLYLLLADDNGDLMWATWTEVKVTNIED